MKSHADAWICVDSDDRIIGGLASTESEAVAMALCREFPTICTDIDRIWSWPVILAIFKWRVVSHSLWLVKRQEMAEMGISS